MALALALGRRGLGRTWPNPAVGAVIVRDDGAGPVIVGRGWTQPGGRPHAETEALARAGAAARGATLYVTLEPCSHHGKTPPCADAIIAAGIARVVSALDDPNPRGRRRRPLADGRSGHRGRGRRRRRGGAAGACRPHPAHARRPSARDPQARGLGRRQGRAAGPAARRHHRRGRARTRPSACARPAMRSSPASAPPLADDPLLTCRLPGMADRSPVRVVLDSALRLPLDSRLVATARETPLWVVPARRRRTSAQRPCGSVAPRSCACRRRTAGSISRAVLQQPRRARHHAADGRGRADPCGGVPCGRSRGRGGAVPLAGLDRRRRHRCAGGPSARGADALGRARSRQARRRSARTRWSATSAGED